MDVKDSYLHGTIGVVKSISVNADKLTYTLADINQTATTITLPVATQSANGLLSSADKIKLDKSTGINQSIPYIVGPDTDTTAGTWTGTYSGITEYNDGLTIIYVPKVAGASTTTLNINNIGSKVCYYSGSSKLTTHYPAGTPILLTYSGGYWKRADYYYDSLQLRVYRQTTGYDADYPILVSRTLASSIGTSGSDNSYSNIYGLIGNDTTKTPTINPLTGEIKAPKFTGNLEGSASKLNNLSSSDFVRNYGVVGANASGNSWLGYTYATEEHGGAVVGGVVSVGTDKYYFQLNGAINKYGLSFRYSNNDNLSEWKEIAFKADIPTKVSQFTNDSGYLTNQSLANYVTLDSEQIITGAKTFQNGLNITNYSPFVIKGSESSDIYHTNYSPHFNWGISNTNYFGIPHALNFKWYHNIWNIGAIRGGSSNTVGFGIGLSALDSDGNFYIKPALRVAETESYINEYKIYHQGNLTKVSQLNNDSGYVTGGPYLPTAGGVMDTNSYISWTNINNKYSNSVADWSTVTGNGIRVFSSTTTDSGAPTTFCTALHVKGPYGFQLVGQGGDVNSFFIRNIELSLWNTLIHSNNYTSYSPKLDGTGATGTWGINITGSASKLTTPKTIWGQSFDGSSNITGDLTTAGTINATTFKGNLDWSYIQNKPTSLPANGGDADTVDGKHANDFLQVYNNNIDDYVQCISLPRIKISYITGQGDFGSLTIPTYSNNKSDYFYQTELRFNIRGGLKYRNLSHIATNEFKSLLDSSNYTDYVNTTTFPGLNATGTVTSVKVGSTSYSPSSGVISLPDYPTSLPANGGNADTVDGKHASDFLLLTGGTLTGWLNFDNEKGISQINRRYREGAGGWNNWTIVSKGPNNEVIYNLGAYGQEKTIHYVYLGLNNYNEVNFRIYPNKITYGVNTILHAGNYTDYVNTTNFPGLNKTGTVTSVGLSVPTGFSVSSSPITTSGTLSISFASGYSLPTTVKQTNWDTVYNWYTGVTAEDTDALVNKWGEIVDFLDSVAEGTDITDEFVTRKTNQEITGAKTFTGTLTVQSPTYKKYTKLYSIDENSNCRTIIQGGNFTHSLMLYDSFTTSGLNYATLSGGYIDDAKLILRSYDCDTTNNTASVKTATVISTGASTFAGQVTAKKFITGGGTSLQFVKGNGDLDSTTYATMTQLEDLENQLAALSAGIKVTASLSVSTIYKNTATSVKITGTTKDNAGNITASEIVIKEGSTILATANNVATTSHTKTVTTTSSSTVFTVTAIAQGLPLSTTVTLYARYPVMYGMGTSAENVYTNGSKASARTSAVSTSTYNATASANNVRFYLLVPSDVTRPTSFTMGGAPVDMVIPTATTTIGGIAYYVFYTNAIYNSGAAVQIKAN